MNILGVESIHRHKAILLRTTFPVRYGTIDFGLSRRFHADNAPHLADVYIGRLTKAPELDLKIPYDPFAADVYQTGSMFLNMFWVCFLSACYARIT